LTIKLTPHVVKIQKLQVGGRQSEKPTPDPWLLAPEVPPHLPSAILARSRRSDGVPLRVSSHFLFKHYSSRTCGFAQSTNA
jgi:hypothetical protein